MEEFKLNIDLTKYKLQVTYFPKTIGADELGSKISIESVIRKSSTIEYQQKVAKLRALDEAAVKQYKYKFPCIIPHAVVSGGADKEHITEETNLLLCDWDFASREIAKEKFPVIAKVLEKHLIFNRFSISGTGVHTLLLIDDPKNRLRYIENIDARFIEFGINQDPKFRNIVQKAIITSPEGQILNPSPIPFTGIFEGVTPIIVAKTPATTQRVSGPAKSKKKDENPVRMTVEYLRSKYSVVRDSLTGNITVNGQLLNDSLIATLIMDALLHGFMANKDLIAAWVKSSFVNVEHRFDEFIEKYSHMHPQDVIKTLAKSITLESPSSAYPNFLEDCLRLWLVKMIAQMYETHANELTIFFIGPQNIGKSYFFSHLLPDELKDLFAEISFKNDKDFKVACTKYILIIDDEIKSRIQDIDFVKSLLTSPFVNVRKVYDVIDYNYKRIASFCGTSNDPQLLSDPSGNRRFCCFLLKSIDRDIYASVDKVALFVEAFNLYKSGYPLEVPKELIAAIQDNSKQFEVLSLAEEILIDHFPPADPLVDRNGEWFWWPVHHLVEQINSRIKTRVKEYHVGLALKKLKYQSKYALVGRSKLRVFAVRPTLGQDWGEIIDGPVNVLPPL